MKRFVKRPLVDLCCRIALLCACAMTGCSGQRGALGPNTNPQPPPAQMVEALNALRNDINGRYGYRNGAPRINLGPCGRFARDFRTAWNPRFRDPVTVAFIMSTDGKQCHHVLIKLPDGTYYDGGNGVVTEAALMSLYSDSRIDDMKEFDGDLLDRRSYGLGRTYPECPNYSDEFTREAIDRRLGALVKFRVHR